MRGIFTRIITGCLCLIAFALSVGHHCFAEAEKSIRRRSSSEFEAPPILVPRVRFWVDIFSRYGKYQIVIHHRHFPQIIFKVLDFGKAAEELDLIALDSLKRKVEKERVEEIKGYLKNLVQNEGKPSNETERHIVQQMSILPGGVFKYKQMLNDDLVRTQTGIKEKFGDAIRRTGRYLGTMERIFIHEEGLPVELTRLPFVESSFDYTAYSSVGAAGIWQFMRGTAKKYMTVNNLVDERLDPILATRAAAKYLKGAYRSLGNWPLAITSYNHGVAGVYKKMKAQGTTDLARIIEKKDERVFGFASSNFFPEFLAALEVYDNYRKYFPDLRLDPPLELKEFPITRPIFLGQAARTVQVPEDELRAANYALLSPVSSNKRPIPTGYVLRVPLSGVTSEQIRQSEIKKVPPKPLKFDPNKSKLFATTSGQTHIVKKGDTLQKIAKKYGTNVSALIRDNGLKGQIVKVGQKLRVQKPVAPSKESKKATTKKKGKAKK